MEGDKGQLENLQHFHQIGAVGTMKALKSIVEMNQGVCMSSTLRRSLVRYFGNW